MRANANKGHPLSVAIRVLPLPLIAFLHHEAIFKSAHKSSGMARVPVAEITFATQRGSIDPFPVTFLALIRRSQPYFIDAFAH